MSQFLMACGALLTAGPAAKITDAAFHAEVDPGFPAASAFAVDFDGCAEGSLERLLVLASNWNRSRVHRELVPRYLSAGSCSLADVLVELARATGATTVHLASHWNPEESTLRSVTSRGIELVAHPLARIRRAALVEDQRYRRWEGLPPMFAA